MLHHRELVVESSATQWGEKSPWKSAIGFGRGVRSQ
jgi:hypothetical protein